MRLTIEAEKGWVSESPEKALEALARIASAEGVSREDFLLSIAKAAGATSAGAHAADKSRWRVLLESSSEAKRLYEIAISVAVEETMALFSRHFMDINKDKLRREESGS